MQTSNPPPTLLTFPAVLAHAARTHGARVAVQDGATRLSFTALEHIVLRIAAAFLAAGICRGTSVAIWAPNGWQWIATCLGAHMAGAAIVPLNTRLKGAEAAYILNRSRACCLVTAGVFLGVDHATLLDEFAIPALRLKLRFDSGWDEFLATGTDVAAARAAGLAVSPDDASDILFTSGTTGQPKGVVATHAQSVRVFQVWAQRVGLVASDRYLVVNPFFHTFGYKAGWLACLLTGATCYPMAMLDVAAVASLVAREAITVLPGPPTLFISLLQDAVLAAARWAPLASLRVAVTGAATIAPDLIRRMRTDLAIDTVLTGYGLTESCGVVTMSVAGDNAETVAHSCGQAIPGVELRIDAPADAPAGTAGEILVRGYNVMAGYFEDPGATAATIDSDGWLHTGDVGYLDGKSYLHITDRLKDMYISGGFNCYPAEIERVLAAHPDVAQAAIIGVPDLRMGEVGVAFVVPRQGADLHADTLLSWARTAMANYKVPRAVRILSNLPLNASGKVMKGKLREDYKAGLDEAVPSILVTR